jgi:hypothetical protein
MAGMQTFIDSNANGWTAIDFLPGVTLLPLAQPVKDGSIHRVRLSKGTVIPVHTPSRRIRHGSKRHRPNRWAAL